MQQRPDNAGQRRAALTGACGFLASEKWGWRGGRVADCRVTHTSPAVDISPDAPFPGVAAAGVTDISTSVRGRDESRAETMSTETASGPTEDQVEILEYNFNKVNKHPDPTTLCLIAAEAGLSEEETQKWFKQRLAQWRQSEGLPSECRSVTD
ncbi:homeodomain-only protein [Ursus maritimus]|nr:homeodomain-only protein [Ursus maritimus]